MEHTSKSIIGTESKELADKKIVLCICGSVAAVKSPEIARELMRHGAEVYPVMSESAKKIIHPYLMEWSTGNPCITELTGRIEHVELCGKHEKKADLLLIAPATANTISKIACGIDDTTVTTFATTALGSKIPVIIVPAMHESMYENPIIEKNIYLLKSQGIIFIDPKIAHMKAHISPTEHIVKTICSIFTKKDLKDKRILITAGPTIEHIDPVRIITNPGSGKTGIYLAKAAHKRGADVTLITGNIGQLEKDGYKIIQTKTTSQMYNAVKGNLKDTDIFIHTASVADFTLDASQEKISTDKKTITLTLKPTIKIIDEIKKIKKDIFLVGFKADHSVKKDILIEKAKKKLEKSDADMIVANDVSIEGCGFGTDENKVIIVDKKGKVMETEKIHKKDLADLILDEILKRTQKPI
ncbi:MAG: bifunctional phosphopantothenoylcysteine decarboxylase/phosphopantothenate--cysteine ligase CoaBC [archaeon]